MARGVLAVEGDRAFGGGFQPGEKPEERGLAGPGRPEQR
jgi:hypothetical protein